MCIFALHSAGDMQEAPEIAADESLGLGIVDGIDFVVGHFCGDIGTGDAKASSESAASLVIGGGDGRIMVCFEEESGLVVYVEFPQP